MSNEKKRKGPKVRGISPTAQETPSTAKEEKPREPEARYFTFTQYEKNPETGESLDFSEENIKNLIEHKTIKEYAYIKHDKDRYTEEEEAEGKGKAGELKPEHWHGVAYCEPAKPVSTIARWLGIPANLIEIKKGRGVFLDCVQYLTHETEKQQKAGKYLYQDSEVVASFDFRAALNDKLLMKERYGRDLNTRERMLVDVLNYGKTLEECKSEDIITYTKNIEALQKNRKRYISEQEPPELRLNIYIYGEGGTGKTLMSQAIARALYPEKKKDSEIFFTVGAKNATFEGYDGQPVIIWNDCRAAALLNTLGGRDNLLNIFDPHPVKKVQNIKYGSINLTNTINIINGQEDYVTFLNALAGEYKDSNGNEFKAEDKSQTYRRIPLIVPTYEGAYDLLINKGFLYNTREFFDYEIHNNIKCNLQLLYTMCNKTEARELEGQMVKLIKESCERLIMLHNQKKLTREEALEYFKDYGEEQEPNLASNGWSAYIDLTDEERIALELWNDDQGHSDFFD